MATTTESVRKILVGGEWYETGETLDVTSPFDGSVVAQVAYGGRADAERAVDAAARAMEQPVPAHERAAVLDRVAGLLRERREELARDDLAARPESRSRPRRSRPTGRCRRSSSRPLEARALGGELIGMDAHPAGVNHAGMVVRRPIGVVGAISPFNFPLNLVAHKIGPAFAAGCACRPQARHGDAALGAPPGAGVRRRRPAGRVAERHRREVERDRRRPDRRRARQADHVHRLVGRGLEAPRAGGAQEGEPRARQLDAAHRDGRRRHREGGDRGGGQRLRVRRPELHLDPARLRRGRGLRRFVDGAPAEGRGARHRRSARPGDPGRARDRRGEPRPDPGVGQGGGRRRARRSSPAARPTRTA